MNRTPLTNLSSEGGTPESRFVPSTHPFLNARFSKLAIAALARAPSDLVSKELN